MLQWWAVGRTRDGLKVDLGGALVSTAYFPELVTGGGVEGRNRPDKGFGADKGSIASLYRPKRQKSMKMIPVEDGGA